MIIAESDVVAIIPKKRLTTPSCKLSQELASVSAATSVGESK
jgi:hypothetical protein